MTRINCWYCGVTAHYPPLKPGWSVRSDGVVAACPKHCEMMPPRPRKDR